eukprot:14852319-Alexandrium_andersonii.AAC.1
MEVRQEHSAGGEDGSATSSILTSLIRDIVGQRICRSSSMCNISKSTVRVHEPARGSQQDQS